MPRNDFINTDGTINYDNITSLQSFNNHLTDNTPHRQFMDSFSAWGLPITENYDAFRVDIGNYGLSNEFHGGGKVLSSVSGAISVPSTAINSPSQANGVVGYAKTVNPNCNVVGGYFQGQVGVVGANAWGINPLVEDCGYNSANIWGCEVNVNVTNANTVARGIDIIGGSTVQPSIGIALRIGPLGTFSTPFIKWTEGLRFQDGATDKAILIGSKLNDVSDSQELHFRGRFGAEGQYNECIMQSTAGGIFTILSPNNGFMKFQGQAAAITYDALNVVGNKVGIMTSSCIYTLQVNGDAQLSGMFACNGATPRSKQTVNAAATDATTTMNLVNQIRTALINNGICI